MRGPTGGKGWTITDETDNIYEILNIETGYKRMIYRHTFLVYWNDLNDEEFDRLMRVFASPKEVTND